MTTKLYVVGKAIYGRCAACGRLVKVNKRVFGSMHFCEPKDPPRIKVKW